MVGLWLLGEGTIGWGGEWIVDGLWRGGRLRDVELCRRGGLGGQVSVVVCVKWVFWLLKRVHVSVRSFVSSRLSVVGCVNSVN